MQQGNPIGTVKMQMKTDFLLCWLSLYGGKEKGRIIGEPKDMK